MELTFEIALTDDRLRKLPQRLEKAAQRLINTTAFDIEGKTKVNAPVDTGFLKNSIYTMTASGESSYSAAPEMLPEVERAGDLTAVVAVGAEYGVYVEYGTARQAAQPYLTPAVEAAKSAWEAGLNALFEDALR